MDEQLSKTYSILAETLGELLQKQLKSSTFVPIPPKYLFPFIKKIKDLTNNHHSDKLILDFYRVYLIANSLFKYYQDRSDDIKYPTFRNKLYLPFLIYILLKFFPKPRAFIIKQIKLTYNKYRRKNPALFYKLSQIIDQDVIKTDILYLFLTNQLLKFDPSTIENISGFYNAIFSNILYYYLKSNKDKREIQLISGELVMFQESKIPPGFIIYRDIAYELQSKKVLEQSITLSQLRYNYEVLRDLIIDNEFQNVYYSSSKNNFILTDSCYKLTKLYQESVFNSKRLLQLKKLCPTIYKLLKSVRIYSNRRPYDATVVTPKIVKTVVYDELCSYYRNIFDTEYLNPILEQVSENFTNSVLTGEYINLFTLSSIKINQVSFIKQIRDFIRFCLT